VELVWARRAVAVLPINVPREQYSDIAGSVREEWTTALVARGVPVVERAQVDKVLAEMGIQQTFLVDPETTSRLGELMGAYAVLTGSVTPAGLRLKVHARLVKVRTGEALLAASGDVDPQLVKESGLLPEKREQPEALPPVVVIVPVEPEAEPAPQQASSPRQALQRRVTLRAPYPESYPGADTQRMAVQYAVMAIARQVGLNYDFDESYKNTNPQCRAWVTPTIVNMPAHEALDSILTPKGLSYRLRGDSIVLVRR
jgi:TolB-like protein